MPHLDAEDERPSPPAPPAPDAWTAVLADRARRARAWAAAHARRTRSWAREQPPAQLVTWGVGAVVAVLAAWLVLWLLVTIVGAVGSALFGSDEPAPAPPPESREIPGWLAEIQHAGLWTRVVDAVHSYAAAAAPAAGTPAWLLLAIWGGIGAAALVGGWWSAGGRWLATTLAWWTWLGVTAWIIWTATPGGNPVPAGLIAALGVLVAVQPWTAPFVGALVVIGLL